MYFHYQECKNIKKTDMTSIKDEILKNEKYEGTSKNDRILKIKS
jgi:hypothetical protein